MNCGRKMFGRKRTVTPAPEPPPRIRHSTHTHYTQTICSLLDQIGGLAAENGLLKTEKAKLQGEVQKLTFDMAVTKAMKTPKPGSVMYVFPDEEEVNEFSNRFNPLRDYDAKPLFEDEINLLEKKMETESVVGRTVKVFDRYLFAGPVRGRIINVAVCDGAYQVDFFSDNPGGPNVVKHNGKYFHFQQCQLEPKPKPEPEVIRIEIKTAEIFVKSLFIQIEGEDYLYTNAPALCPKEGYRFSMFEYADGSMRPGDVWVERFGITTHPVAAIFRKTK